MATQSRPATPEEVVGKVLRRVEVAQMARKLQDRLALASYITQNGLDTSNPHLVEAHLENTLKRRRPGSSISTSSDSSSATSDHPFFSAPWTSSPHTAAVFSDDFPASRSERAFSTRSDYKSITARPEQGSATRKRNRTHSMAPPLIDASRRSWSSGHDLPDSSPSLHQHAHFQPSHTASLSFVSGASTVPNTPPFGPDSDDKVHEHLDHSFNLNTSSHFRSSPPCTPPPTRSRKPRALKRNGAGEEGAELLMHLATSPSPAKQGMRSNLHPPSTPPSDQQALSSSMMPMSGTSGFFGGFSTPGQNFAWADFINVTPSPAQGAFGNRTPGVPRTPLAAKEARRRLNLDSLGNSGGSPNLSNVGRGSISKDSGLGMELGGELVS
ncbi:MAG: hypothetical protein LQ344_000584 [Seirophora lacunosa]|nr:MAG: hypothetical protein LQ344_000584 [Seirophora lacunosa]